MDERAFRYAVKRIREDSGFGPAHAIREIVEDQLRRLAEWTDRELARAASTLPDGTDVRARLLVRDVHDGGQLVRREVVIDGEVYASALINITAPPEGPDVVR